MLDPACCTVSSQEQKIVARRSGIAFGVACSLGGIWDWSMSTRTVEARKANPAIRSCKGREAASVAMYEMSASMHMGASGEVGVRRLRMEVH